MEFFDILIIVIVVIAAVVVLGLVYWFMSNTKHKNDTYEDMKNNVFNISYNIKKNLLDSLSEDKSLPVDYNELLNKSARIYSSNCDEIKLMKQSNKEVPKEKIKQNKRILKTLLTFEKSSVNQQYFNKLIFDKYIDKLKENIK
jgi:hypothetical protein